MTDHAAAQTAHPPRHVHRLVIRRRARIIAALALGLIAGATIAAFYIYLLTLRTPQWFAAADSLDATPARAIEFENAVLTEFSKVRPVDAERTPDQPWRSQPWAVAIDPADLNNWLRHHGPRWASHQAAANAAPAWPDALQTLRLTALPDYTLRIGAVVKENDLTTRFFALQAVPEVRPDGLWLHTRKVEIGDLSLSATWVLDRARRMIRQMVPADVRALPDLETLLDAASGTRPLVSQPAIRLADGRKVLILEIRCEENRLILTCQTLATKR
jgi:hypothetical protein